MTEMPPGGVPLGPATALPPGGVPWDVTLSLRAADGVALRGALWNPQGERGLALALPGRTEFLEKVSVPAAALVERGFAVASLDWRGQGLSARLLANPLKGHAEHFEHFDLDLAALLADPAVARLGPVRLVFAHSMGGAIALGAMGRGRLRTEALVLSAPMAGIAGRGLTRFMMGRGARALRRLGLGHRWPPLPDASDVYVFRDFEGNCLTGDEALYAWLGDALREEPRLQLALPTIGWLAAAHKAVRRIHRMPDPHCPVQVFVGSREGVVDATAVKALGTRIAGGAIVLDGARHDLPLETPPRRAVMWRAVDDFLAALPEA